MKPSSYKATLSELHDCAEYEIADPETGLPEHYSLALSVGAYETIKRSLLIADKLMQEASNSMLSAGRQYGLSSIVTNWMDHAKGYWDVMRDQLIRDAVE